MKNIDLETFYKRIKKSIEIVVAYTGNEKYRTIIRHCRLKPLEMFDNTLGKEPKLFNIWVDEYSNTLDVISGVITLNDPKAPAISKRSTDLFLSITFSQHIEKAIRGMFLGDDFPEMIAFYGGDEYIRCVNVGGFGMTRISPLEFDPDALSRLIAGRMGPVVSDKYRNGVIVKIDEKLKIEDLFDGR